MAGNYIYRCTDIRDFWSIGFSGIGMKRGSYVKLNYKSINPY